MQRMTFLPITVLLLFVVWSGCSVNSVTPDTTPKTITTTVAGQVVDEFGKPVQGVQIAAYGKSALTNQYGTFLMKDVVSPEGRTLVKASKSGYLDAFCAEQPIAHGITQMRIGIMGNIPQGTFPASTGRTVTALFSTATVTFPANGYVTENGEAYTGDVKYIVRHLDPTAANFYDFLTGDFRGVRADGSATEMLSYGVLRMELYGSNGEKLNLAVGKTATLSFPIVDKMEAIAPPEMPLWSFNEATGIWKEEGKAIMQGNVYVGTVSHLLSWNCGVPAQTAMLRIRVICGNEGVPGILVRIGERTAVTDTNGYASRRVPEGLSFTVKVYSETNDGLESVEITAGPYAAGTTNQLDIPLTRCPAYIKGDLYDCGNSPIYGTVIAEYASGGFAYSFAQNGGFHFRVKAGVGIILKAFTPEGKESEPVILPPLISIQVSDIGILDACKSSTITAQDYDVNTDVADSPALKTTLKLLLSADGMKTFLFNGGIATVVHTSTGEVIRRITYSTSAKLDSLGSKNSYEISSDGSLMLVGVEYGKYALYDVNTGTKLRDFEGKDDKYVALHLSPDGTLIAAKKEVVVDASKYYRITILNAATGDIMKDTNTFSGQRIEISQFTDFFTNNSFAISAQSQDLKVVNVADFSILQTISTQSNPIVAQSSDGSVIATSKNGKEVSFFNTQSSTKLGVTGFNQQNYYSTTYGTALTNDRFVAQLIDNTGKYSQPSLFAVAGGQFIKSLPGANTVTYYYGLQFSAEGKKLVGVYVENSRLKLRVWNF